MTYRSDDCMVIAVGSTKGGVSKTTLTANLAAYLSSLSFRVLCVDADIQPSLSGFFPIDDLASKGLQEFVEAGVQGCISQGRYFDLIHSNDPTGRHLGWMLGRANGRIVVRKRLEEIREDYDYILIDTQGARSVMLDAVLVAADVLLSPVQPTTAAGRELFRGTLEVVQEVNEIRASALPVCVALVMVEPTITRDAREAMEQIEEGLRDTSVNLLASRITKAVAWNETASRAMPLGELGGRNPRPFEELQSLATDLLGLGVQHG